MDINPILSLLVETKNLFDKLSLNEEYSEIYIKIVTQIKSLTDLKFQEQPILLEQSTTQEQTPLLDFFVLEYDFHSDKYFILGQSEEKKPDRQNIFQLMIGSMKNHKKQKQKTNSMTELWKLTSNVATHGEPIILPNYISEHQKYVYMYQTKECVMKLGKYYLVDRYYCFITYKYALTSIYNLFKQIKVKVFENRLLSLQSPENVEWLEVKRTFQEQFQQLKVLSFSYELFSQKTTISPLFSQLIAFKHKDIEAEEMPLAILLFYFICREFKLIFVSNKQDTHKITQIVLSIEALIYPLQYLYPIVYAYGKNHMEFIESPVPIIVHYWSESKKIGKYCKELLEKENGIPSILFDLSEMRTIYYSELQFQDTFILNKLMNYILKYGKGNCIGSKLSNFIKTDLLCIESDLHGQWYSLLRKCIKSTQMYDIWAKS